MNDLLRSAILLLAVVVGSTDAFVCGTAGRPAFGVVASRKSTKLFLEDWVADMIDKELHRQHHKQDYEKEWMEKNHDAMMHVLHDNTSEQDYMMNLMDDGGSAEEFRQLAKDRKMAMENPQKYCADRCVTTGNCDVFEDIFEMTPQEVLTFCEDCVLNEGEEPCDIPEPFYDNQLKP